MEKPPQIAILGAGIFVKTQYIPRLSEISDIVRIKFIWSRTEESAKAAVELARKSFPEVESKWGDEGLDHIIRDSSIPAVFVVEMSLRMLKAGKHVLQAFSEIETAFQSYHSISAVSRPIWAVGENYRFEPAFVESKKLVNEIGKMLSFQVIIEGSMNSSNPYFSSSWRRNFALAGCEVTRVSASTTHVDTTLPPPDSISSLFELENGCSGVFVMVVSSPSPKIFWRIVGLKGTVQVERGIKDGRHGYLASVYGPDGQCKSSFYPFSGVTQELKCFIHDFSQAALKKDSSYEAEVRGGYLEGARDVAVLEAMLESGAKGGCQVDVKCP
ncbi:hypothetical protein RJ641_034108 [Dillenia turbinata]|uniref:Gfo/Idh/MocA-like oxidoreductase N-terminal domain-containing protein n=1 Tax=Dillenia turbinata TaxID=194707 RepID=A0AAN8VZF4_9MAGN